MTDLISSLAESIVALINAKPQSPTKDEVEKELRRWVRDGKLSDPYAYTPPPRDMSLHEAVNSPDPYAVFKWYDAQPKTRVMPLPHKDPSPELMQLLDGARDDLADISRHFLSELSQAEKDHRELREAHEKQLARIFNEPFEKAYRPCLDSADGSHVWIKTMRYDHVAWEKPYLLCSCGATKPA